MNFIFTRMENRKKRRKKKGQRSGDGRKSCVWAEQQPQ